ncbi:MAG: CBS domain-containing protein [Cyclobacteriaceae bacterium]
MGEKDVKLIQSADEKGQFIQQLFEDLKAFKLLLNQEKLEKNNARIGAELEVNLLNDAYEPVPVGLDIYKKLKRARVKTEYARFNLEINSKPTRFTGKCLSRLGEDLARELYAIEKAAKQHEANVLLTGIVPTIGKQDISYEMLTPEPRYKALHNLRKEIHGDNYEYNIRGIDQLATRDNLMLFAGCMTSFQVHLQINPEELKDKYNWAQMISGPLLACCTNSPLFLGKRLWQETRIALFEQAADTRKPSEFGSNENSRVYFGDKWVEDSILELFQEDISFFEPLFAYTKSNESCKELESGKIPNLDAWNYYNGSIYRWNRVCYGVLNNKPSLRIENRILPSGPSMEDMIANAAFWLGMMNGMPDKYKDFHKRIAFSEAKNNFFKAARLGLDVQFDWLRKKPVPAHELILKELIPIATEGLKQAKVDKGEADHYLSIIRERVSSRKTGAHWISDSYTCLTQKATKEDALRAVTAGMLSRQVANTPVHTWSPAQIEEAGPWKNRFKSLRRFMTTSLFKVKEDDIATLALHLMNWKNVGHIPVENSEGNFVGLITRNSVIDFVVNRGSDFEKVKVNEIMLQDLITVTPDTHLDSAIDLILHNKVSCLPVVEESRIVGIVTDHDFVIITNSLVGEMFKKTLDDQRKN